jgi:hypothetical protein
VLAKNIRIVAQAKHCLAIFRLIVKFNRLIPFVLAICGLRDPFIISHSRFFASAMLCGGIYWR